MVIIKTRKVTVVLLSLIILTGCSGTMPKLGLDNGNLMKCPNSPNCVNSQIKNDKHFIQAIVFKGKSEEVKTRILKILDEMKRTKVVVAKDNYIHAEIASTIFHFVDDLEFYFPDTEDKETSIQVRSASRIGYTDFGVNQKRVEQFRTLLK